MAHSFIVSGPELKGTVALECEYEDIENPSVTSGCSDLTYRLYIIHRDFCMKL
ncbi:hypothetical protein [Marinomonas sp. 2405UD68-3]|uniref:hypothetical protein n=1 Tax=Marinomonas sp. 2405UD68-3 TaxID=3391835 RepID=UPI0039C98A22